MKLIAKLAMSVWIAVGASIALSFFFWRTGNLRPHAFWAVLSIASVAAPMLGLAVESLVRVARGPSRLRAIGWLLVGATPLVWFGAYFANLVIDARTRAPIVLDTPFRLTLTWLSPVLDLEARWRYPRRTFGQHSVLMDAGQTPDADRLVSEMDDHLEAMAMLLGQPVPDYKYPWVRGSLFGQNRRTIFLWAMCGQKDNPGELTDLDRHENAHALITALAGPDHDPPFVLIEGWAESQSEDRDTQISSLAERYNDGSTYSLEELVGPHWYGRGSGPVYWEGGPLVHYLMDHYGPEKFLELYSGVRSETFYDDCQAILGDSWKAVENEFWQWVESEDQQISKKKSQEPSDQEIKFADSVNPADWEAFVEEYRNSHIVPEPLPSKLAFLIEIDYPTTIEKIDISKQPLNNVKSARSNQPSHYEVHTILEGKSFWIFENYLRRTDRFFLATEEHCANLTRDEAGVLQNWVKDHHDFSGLRREVISLLQNCRGFRNSGTFLPLSRGMQLQRTFIISEMIRPEEGSEQPWGISFTTTSQTEDEKVIIHHQVELDPAFNWAVVRHLIGKAGSEKSLWECQYQRINGVVLPSVARSRRESQSSEEFTSMLRLRPLTESEQIELKKRVELAVQSAPPRPPSSRKVKFKKLRRVISTVAYLCPICGILLLGFSQRKQYAA